jgi:xylan 1,4-beta-xylosidase
MAALIASTVAATWTFSAMAAEPTIETTTVRVFADQPIGTIKKALGGVSQGGNADSFLKNDVLAAMKDLPTPMVRLEAITSNTTYTLYDPATGKYDWTKLDQEIETIQARGGEIIANIYCTPKWLASDPDMKLGGWWYSAPKDEKAWAKYVGDIVRHVNIEKKYGIKYWEVWNEPSGGHFFTAWRFGPDKFWRLYQVTANAIKLADPTALVGGFGDNANYPEHCKGFFQYCKRHTVPMDFLTVHWYGEWPMPDAENQPAAYYHLTKAIDGQYQSFFKRSVPIFVTEWNLQAESDRFAADKQAAFIGQALFWMQESPTAGAMFFRVEEYSVTRGAMLDAKFQPRVAYRILKMFAMLSDTRVNVRDTSADTTVLATKTDRNVAVMISRLGADGAAVRQQRLSLAGHKLTGACRVKIYVEDAANASRIGPMTLRSETTLQMLPGVPVTIDVGAMTPHSVALVAIEK